MSSQNVPDELPISMQAVCTLSQEYWRLNHLADLLKDSNEGVALRRIVRSLYGILTGLEIEVIDLTGRPYDPGMVPDVIDIREDRKLADGLSTIDEYIAPTVAWRGQIVKPGKIILRRSYVATPDNSKAVE